MNIRLLSCYWRTGLVYLFFACAQPCPATPDPVYHYPLYPWSRDYHQSLVVKLKSSTGDVPPTYVCNVGETLRQIEILHHLSRGMPIIVYLSGWQEGGHDHQTPILTKPGSHLMRPGIDSTPLDALKWLIAEGRKWNATVSLHINILQAVDDNEMYARYKKEDLLCRDVSNAAPPDKDKTKAHLYGTDKNEAGQIKSRINMKLEWEKGFTQKRIDGLLEMLPELAEGGTIYLDNLQPFSSPGHNSTAEDMRPYLKCIMDYFKTKYSMDVVSEYTFHAGREQDNFYGFQPWALSFRNMSQYHMRVPAYMYCGGRNYDDAVFGCSADYMNLFYTSDWDSIKENLYTRTFPLVYLSRLIRLAYTAESGSGVLSNNVTSTWRGKSNNWMIKSGEDIVKERGDVFLPALWRSTREMIAYSMDGYSKKEWKFPSEWRDVSSVDIYEIGMDGLTVVERKRAVANNAVTLTLGAQQALAVLPAGSNQEQSAPIPFSGKATFLGEDRETKGSWIGAYGADGYEIVNGEAKLPGWVRVSYVGGKVATWEEDSTDLRALQNPTKSGHRMIAQRATPIHEVIDVQLGDDAPRNMALYSVDWDHQNRKMIVDAVCANTNHALHTRILRDFSDGVYLRYRITNRIQFRLTILGEDGNTFSGGNVTYSGIFLGSFK